MSEAMRALRSDEPLMVEWERFKATSEYQNALHWVERSHPEGSLWALFMAGFIAGTKRAADAHENVNPASDRERLEGSPGAGAMGAVVEYRDLIRKALP